MKNKAKHDKAWHDITNEEKESKGKEREEKKRKNYRGSEKGKMTIWEEWGKSKRWTEKLAMGMGGGEKKRGRKEKRRENKMRENDKEGG